MRKLVCNDLEGPVMEEHPVVAGIKKTLIENGAEISLMSGSGPTVFGVFSSPDGALKAAKIMSNYWCRAVTTIADDIT